MGKQLYFFHTEEDTMQLMSYIEKNHGKIIINSILYDPSKIIGFVVEEMAKCCYQHAIVYVPDSSLVKQSKFACIVEGTAIEFSNCRRWSSNSHAYIDMGRIYMHPARDGTYDEHTLTLYMKIYRYIKKRYTFNKELGAYLSNSVQAQYVSQAVFLSQMGHPLPFWTAARGDDSLP